MIREDCLVTNFDGPVRAISCARSIAASIFRARICVHTGEIACGGESPTGPAVDRVVELARSAGEGEILVTRIVKDIAVDSGLRFACLDDVDAESDLVFRVT